MTVLSDFRTRVRYAQGLTTTSTERGFSDNNLDQHVKEAVEQFSLYVPIEATATITVTGGTRTFNLSSLTRPIRVVAVEYPTGNWPRRLLDHDVYAGVVTLDHPPPAANYDVRVYYHQQHLVDGSGSTIEAEHETVIVEGGAVFALLARAAGFANTLETSAGAAQYMHHLRVAQQRYEQWQRLLRALGTQFKRRRLYTPQDRPSSRDIVQPPY